MTHALELDRITPTRPPAGRAPSGSQRWRNLLFLHWKVPAEAVRAAVPAELELDLWGGEALVGVVPFEMEEVRPAWLPGLFALDFLETNLRTYVHHRGEPGVYFFSLEAASRLAVQAARWGWSLPYHHARMTRTEGDGEVSYESVRSADAEARLRVRYAPGPALGASEPGSLAFFLLERYYLFALRRGRVTKGHVHHMPYPAQEVAVRACESTLLGAAGLPNPSEPPFCAHHSPGVDVAVYGPWPVE